MKKTAHFGVNNYLRKSFRLNCSTFFLTNQKLGTQTDYRLIVMKNGIIIMHSFLLEL